MSSASDASDSDETSAIQIKGFAAKKGVEVVLYQYGTWCKREEKVDITPKNKHEALQKAVGIAKVDPNAGEESPGSISVAIPAEPPFQSKFRALAKFDMSYDGVIQPLTNVFFSYDDDEIETTTTLYVLNGFNPDPTYFMIDLTPPAKVEACEHW